MVWPCPQDPVAEEGPHSGSGTATKKREGCPAAPGAGGAKVPGLTKPQKIGPLLWLRIFHMIGICTLRYME